jgi:hypothetical protein
MRVSRALVLEEIEFVKEKSQEKRAVTGGI